MALMALFRFLFLFPLGHLFARALFGAFSWPWAAFRTTVRWRLNNHLALAHLPPLRLRARLFRARGRT